jgi:hypothetical protein
LKTIDFSLDSLYIRSREEIEVMSSQVETGTQKVVLKAKKYTKKQIAVYVQGKLRTDPRWALRALEVVYARQTAAEQQIEKTVEDNGVGFGAYDAEILSSFARQVQAGRVLSAKQFAILKAKITRYWKQVLSVTDLSRLMSLMDKDLAV